MKIGNRKSLSNIHFKGVKLMENLISFDLVPTFQECYIVDNLQINDSLFEFRGEKKIDGAIYELNVYKTMFDIYTNKNSGNTFKTLGHIEQNNPVDENNIDDIQNILKLFKSEMQKYVERKRKWKQKNKINISV